MPERISFSGVGEVWEWEKALASAKKGALRLPYFWTKILREGRGNYLAILFSEAYILFLFMMPVGSLHDPAKYIDFFIILFLLALMQHIITIGIRDSPEYQNYLIQSAEWQVGKNKSQLVNSYVKNHFASVVRIGNFYTGDKFGDLLLINLARRGKSNPGLSLMTIQYALQLDLLDKISTDGVKPLSDYRHDMECSMNNHQTVVAAWTHIIVDRYVSIPEETINIALTHKPDSFVQKMEKHPELMKLASTFLILALLTIVYVVWGVQISMP